MAAPTAATNGIRKAQTRRPGRFGTVTVGGRRIDVRFAVVLTVSIAVYAAVAWVDVGTSLDVVALAVSCAVAGLAGLAIFARARTALAAAALSVVCGIATALSGWMDHAPLLEILALTALLTVLALRRTTVFDGVEIGVVAVALPLISLHSPAPLGMALVLTAASVVAVAAGSVAHHVMRRQHEAVAQTRAEERTRLSRDLHDLVAHHVTGIVVVAREARLETDPHRVEELLSAIENAGTDALRESRRLVSHLRTDESDETDGGAEEHDLAALVRSFQLTGAAKDVSARLPEPIEDPEAAALVHRVVAEALTNIQRHAFGTARVEISVTELGGEKVFVTIDDSGVSGVSAPFALGSGTGLRGLRERLDEVGGSLDSRATSRGWRVQAVIPAHPQDTSAQRHLRRTS